MCVLYVFDVFICSVCSIKMVEFQRGSSSPDSYQQWETSGDSSETTAGMMTSATGSGGAIPVRRSRLFKTRAETKRPSIENGGLLVAAAAVPQLKHSRDQISVQSPPAIGYKSFGIPGQLQRSLSSPQFQVIRYSRYSMIELPIEVVYICIFFFF